MKAKNTSRETLASNEELSRRLAELEQRVARHDKILHLLKSILEQLNESGYRLAMTAAQHAELNRWLNECERSLRSRMRSSELN